MGIFAAVEGWLERLQRRRTQKLTASAFDIHEDEEQDLVVLYDRGLVTVTAGGQSITSIHAQITNLINKRISVVVRPGTYFVSSGNHQNMAATDERKFCLAPISSMDVRIAAACINADRAIPREGDRFDGVHHVSDRVARFLEATRGEDPMVIQAGVWTLTNGYSRHDVVNHLVSKDSHGNSWNPITYDHCDRAKAILDGLKISHRLWRSPTAYENKTETYSNGTYTGEFRYGDRHGRGRYEWSDGDSYDGEWRDNKRTGEGAFVSTTGYRYTGEFVDGEEHGIGRCTWPSGTKYEGQFIAGQPDGQGIKTFSNGDTYEGGYSRGRESGGWYTSVRGRRTWSVINAEGRWEEQDPPGSAKGNATHVAVSDAAPIQAGAPARAVPRLDSSSKYCSRCRRLWTVPNPNTKMVDFARYSRGACPRCEGPLRSGAPSRL